MIALLLSWVAATAYLLAGLRIICFQRNGARYRRWVSLSASGIAGCCLASAVEIVFLNAPAGFAQAALAVCLCVLLFRSRGNVADMLRPPGRAPGSSGGAHEAVR